jgi:dolichol-phosphate mannosyltransferase
VTTPSAPRTGPTGKRAVHIVLPAYNEAESIGSLLTSIRDTMDEHPMDYRVVIVDDGSRDRTADIVEEFARTMPILLLRHEVNQGLGATIRDGIVAATESAGEHDIIVTMDADDTHTPGLIPQMTGLIHEGYDVVVASRFQRGSRVYGVPPLRRLMTRGASVLMRLVFPTRGIRDYTCGYRAYRVTALRAAFARYGDRLFTQQGFQCMVDLLLRLRGLDLVFGEVPFVLRYDRKAGVSKMRVCLGIER